MELAQMRQLKVTPRATPGATPRATPKMMYYSAYTTQTAARSDAPAIDQPFLGGGGMDGSLVDAETGQA